MADRSNAQQAAINQAYTAQVGTNNIVTTVQQQNAGAQQMIVTNAASGSSIPSFGSSFSGNTDYYIQGGQQVRDLGVCWSSIVVIIVVVLAGTGSERRGGQHWPSP